MSDSRNADRSEQDGGHLATPRGTIVFALHAHVPRVLGRYRSIDQQADYFDAYRTRDLCVRYAEECIIPTNRILASAVGRLEGRFRAAVSVSGIALDLFERYAPEAITSFEQLAKTDCVEMLGTPCHQALAFAYSIQGFADEVNRHRERVEELFGVSPRVFRNTELICGEQVANTIAHLGFDGMLCDAPREALAGRSSHRVYGCGHASLPVLMRDPDLTSQVTDAFLGGQDGQEPMVAPQFAERMVEASSGGIAGLFLDYEVFGKRFVTESGIFEFLRHLPDQVVNKGGAVFKTPSEVLAARGPMDELHLGRHVSPCEWGGTLSPWLGGSMQSHAAHQLYALESTATATGEGPLLDAWRCLQGAEYFLSMSMLERAAAHSGHLIPHLDGPYHAYIVFMNILDDLARRLERARSRQAPVRDQVSAD
ncbi:MAG: alpha-amylase [Phycisphaerae bacterium]|nr:MAG: alpha-amylase [Phycisphaerae bacterium]